jgi:hypothetical protein
MQNLAELVGGKIPMTLQGASFRMPERLMNKAHLFINGYSLKNRCNEMHYLLKHPHGAGLETFYATSLISTSEKPFSSINLCLNTFLIPAESAILK